MNYLLAMRTRTWIIILLMAIAGLYGEYRYLAATDSATPVPAETATSTVQALDSSITAVGTVVPLQKADVGFKRAGSVVSLPYRIGARVAEDALLAALDATEAQTAIAKAKSDVLAAQADVLKAQTGLANYESQKSTVVSQAYAKAEDAVKKQLDGLFAEDDTNPRLTFQTTDSQVENDIYTARRTATRTLSGWQAILGIADTVDAASRLTSLRTLLYLAQAALTAQTNLDAATLTAHKTAVTAGLDGINASLSSLNDLAQKLRSQEAEIAAQKARVASAEASELQAEAKLDESYLRAPFAAVITEKHTEVGQFVPAGQPVFSLAGTGFEVQSDIPEAYIGKIRTGMPVTLVLDAYPEKTLKGTITSVEPAGRPINDVVYYRVKISVSNAAYAGLLKNGLTANITIAL